MNFIMMLMYVTFFTYSLVIIFKSKFEKMLPLTLMMSALVLYLSGYFFDTFKIGFILCLLFSLYFPFYIIKNKMKLNEIKEKYLTKGYKAFLVLYLIIFILDFNRFFNVWDELSHWGKMVKEMYRLDNFYSVPSSNLLVHKDYPPIMSLLELFSCMISFRFKEAYLIRTLHLLEGSIVLSMFNFDKEKNIIKPIFLIIFIYFLTLLFDKIVIINSIYTDFALSFVTTYILYNVFVLDKLDKTNIFTLITSLSFLILLKQMSIVFYLMSLFLLAFLFIFNKKINKENVFKFIIISVVPIIFYFSWNMYISYLQIKGQFVISDIKLTEIMNIIKGEGEQHQILINYITAIPSRGILNSRINVSYFHFFFIIALGIYYIYYKLKKDIKLRNILILSLTLFIGYVGYALVMLLLYLFSFKGEGLILASYERYMSTYILICIFTLIFIYLKYLKEFRVNRFVLIFTIVLMMITPRSYLKLRPDLIILENHKYDSYREAAKKIDSVAKLHDPVFVVDQVEQDGAMFYISYFSNKVRINQFNYDVASNLTEKEFNRNYSYMSKFKYLYTFTLEDDFIDNYKFLNKNIKRNTLYKIKKRNNKLYLEEIK